MRGAAAESGIQVFSTCPTPVAGQAAGYLQQVQEYARRSEEAGCEGILVVTDNAQPDPWLVAQAILGATRRLCPLVAVQPVYMHPYSVAKMVSSLALLYGRRLFLNLVAGGFKNDLAALNDLTPHDERYARLLDYAAVLLSLLRSTGPVSIMGQYYKVSNLKLSPPLPAALLPGILVSGSSAAGMEAAQQLGAVAVEYPRPPKEYAPAPPARPAPNGLRIGIIARPGADEAWSVARARYPEDRKGRLTHQLAMKVSDSAWHRQLDALAQAAAHEGEQAYWLVPFQNYKAVCPFLVGSYDQVADELSRYVDAGYRTFILDLAGADELPHAGAVFERAAARCAAA